MPFKYELTWIAHAQRWRKRYLGKTFYLKSDVGGKKDRNGYLAAMDEWARLRDFLDGFGPNPYTSGGRLIPRDRQAEFIPGQKLQLVESAEFPKLEEQPTKAVREQLLAKASQTSCAVPPERTLHDILNRLGYRLRRVRKTKPQKNSRNRRDLRPSSAGSYAGRG